ncbi:DUF1828 domain-containing protein [Sporolactobacillus shoreicorticis]|uniref:DUF1828 domain-containing protein n=1 Tax=Sporolactobacillus shoreicorticis TaxID=1923877 RepID=A0ABW5S568_9BACL|nr:DUF1828 domain-containing protein [Sporolactobacillus shoreicorticis]MCO7127758.1 DUF1828 domain-containing protein [Sporolactobacillus shoreicorticis]
MPKIKNDEILNRYLTWLKKNIVLSEGMDDAIEISSPFVDFMNDNIKIYVKHMKNDKYILSDDGYTLWNLKSLGMIFKKNSTKDHFLKYIIKSKSLNLSDNDEIEIISDKENIGQSIHFLIQGIISISDLLLTHEKSVRSMFLEEVEKYFDKNKDKFDPTRDFLLRGRSQLVHQFNYLMTTRRREKKIVNIINHLDRTRLEVTLLSWGDTHEERIRLYHDDLKMAVIINDSKKISAEYISSLQNYGITPIPFSDKELLYNELTYVE